MEKIMKVFNVESIKPLQNKLNNHQVYSQIGDIESLRLFMEHHIYSVWDFMSLVKYLQKTIAPSNVPWGIAASRNSRRFINSIILEEESDIGLPDKNGNTTYASHFEMYCEAMYEVGAMSKQAIQFSEAVNKYGFEPSIELLYIPEPSRNFMKETMKFIASDKSHVVAAAFALGREKIIPDMFRQILKDMNIQKNEAPAFYYYLERHIHLDEDFHAPLSILMLNELCGGNEEKLVEAETAAQHAIEARIKFWDGVASALETTIRADVA
jgi:hypothetical protein